MTDTERLARIGEPLRLRGLITATHEEQLARLDARLLELYPPAFRELIARGDANEADFLDWYASQAATA